MDNLSALEISRLGRQPYSATLPIGLRAEPVERDDAYRILPISAKASGGLAMHWHPVRDDLYFSRHDHLLGGCVTVYYNVIDPAMQNELIEFLRRNEDRLDF